MPTRDIDIPLPRSVSSWTCTTAIPVLVAVVLFTTLPTDARGQEPAFSASLTGGAENLVESQAGAVLAGDVAARWNVGLELSVGSDLKYLSKLSFGCDFGCAVNREEDLSPFERVQFWTVHLEPRLRVRIPSLQLRPFVGGRIGVANFVSDGSPDREPRFPREWGAEYGVVAGLEYAVFDRIGLEVSGLYGTVTKPRTRHAVTQTFDRTAVRGGVRIHF